MRSRRPDQVDAPGQDSFLDIVANLVGILIILIMLVGVRTKDVLVASADNDNQENKIDVESPKLAANDVAADDRRLAEQVKIQQTSVALRRMERNEALKLVSLLQREMDNRRDQLDKDRRNQFDAQRDLTEAERLLDDLKRSKQVVENATTKTTVLEHVPTPLAKTVFGREVHFRLQDGRLAYVPWDELVRQLKAEATQKTWKLKNAPRVTETIGPVQGFWMKYTLARGKFVTRGPSGPVAQNGFQLEGFVLTQAEKNLGEPLENALRDGSQMNRILAALPTDQTTVTVWVYPESFPQFRLLKNNLLRRGYLTAGRPMPAGYPIGASPNGSRSSAQ